ncbi:hypothetical protein (Partial), partial [Seminavis robusta]|eukprot:Sro1348_g264970.1 n/a (346) ;mRNA; r:324-1362
MAKRKKGGKGFYQSKSKKHRSKDERAVWSRQQRAALQTPHAVTPHVNTGPFDNEVIDDVLPPPTASLRSAARKPTTEQPDDERLNELLGPPSDDEHDPPSGDDDAAAADLRLTPEEMESFLNQQSFLHHDQSERIATYHLYCRVHNFPSDWTGKGSTGLAIKDALGMKTRKPSKNIFGDINYCAKNDLEYVGQRFYSRFKPVKIPDGSKAAETIATLIESRGDSLRIATDTLNECRIDDGVEPYSDSAVRELVQRLPSRKVPIRKMKQGNHDKNSPWARRRFAWVYQLLLRLGTEKETEPHDLFELPPSVLEVPETLLDEEELKLYEEDGTVPVYFDPQALFAYRF